MMRAPQHLRLRVSEFPLEAQQGNNGVFILPPVVDDVHLQVIASDGEGWEHVSVVPVRCEKMEQVGVHGRPWSRFARVGRTPTWEEMCHVRALFWSRHVTVVQYHPPAHEHVNFHPDCLHLWRPIGIDLPRPPKALVGART